MTFENVLTIPDHWTFWDDGNVTALIRVTSPLVINRKTYDLDWFYVNLYRAYSGETRFYIDARRADTDFTDSAKKQLSEYLRPRLPAYEVPDKHSWVRKRTADRREALEKKLERDVQKYERDLLANHSKFPTTPLGETND